MTSADDENRNRSGSRDDEVTLDRAAGPAPAEAPLPLSVGERYRIVRFHARGGLGVVYVAEDGELHREVALKQMLGEDADDELRRERFLVEAEITGGLEHPGIVPVYGLGADSQGRPYYVMRFIRGDSLREAIAAFHADPTLRDDAGRRSLELRKLLRRFLDVCNAIEYAHSRGVLHRDLKPSNIIVGKHGETLVIDWGLAKAQGRSAAEKGEGERPLQPFSGGGSGTVFGSTIGTPGFMSPEQARGDLESLGPASDVYSLGATLYSLLTGKPPFDGPDLNSVLRNVKEGSFPRPRAVDARVDPALEAVCLKAMALSPGDRYLTAVALADDVERWIADEPVTAYRDPLATRLTRWGRRNRAAASSIAVLVVSAVVALTVGSVLVNRERAAAEANFRTARAAVDQYFTTVSENKLLDVPGLQPLRRELLEAAARYYRDFLKERRTDPAVRREAATASFRIGWVEAGLGAQEKALESYREAASLYQEALREDPSNLELRRQLAIAHGAQGLTLQGMGKAEEALAAHARALEIRLAIARDKPDDVKAQIDVARTHGNIGGVYQGIGKTEQALASWDRAVAIATPLLGRDLKPSPGAARDLTGRTDLSWIVRGDLGSVHYDASLALRDLSRLDEARAHCDEARVLFEGLVRDYPADLSLQVSLADVYATHASIDAAAGRVEDAQRTSLRCLEIRQRMAAENPSIPSYRRAWAENLLEQGWILRLQKRRPESATAYRKAADVAEALLALDSSPYTANLLAQAVSNLARVLLESGKPAEALPLARRAVALLEPAVRELPKAIFHRSALGGSLRLLAIVEAAAGHAGEALAALERSIEIQRPLVDTYPVERYNQACALSLMVPLVPPERREAQAAEAMKSLEQAFAAGYADASNLATDTDLDALRKRADFQALLAARTRKPK